MIGNKSLLSLTISDEEKLTKYLAFWLRRFVLPLRVNKIRPQTIHIACDGTRDQSFFSHQPHWAIFTTILLNLLSIVRGMATQMFAYQFTT